MNKIITFNKLINKVNPYEITLISGSFEPFNEYYFRFIKWASMIGGPLIVIIQKDNMLFKRRGFLPISSTHQTRAEIISSLEFVDFVIIANKTACDNICIKKLSPKNIVFQKDNLVYRKILKKKIRANYPNINVKICPFSKKDFDIENIPKISFGKNKIKDKLIKMSSMSKGKDSKISAFLSNEKNIILLEATNNCKEEHAELILLKMANKKNINLKNCTMYVLIPPCLMCANKLVKTKIKNIYYIFDYGDKKGVKYLKSKGINVKKY